MTDPKHSEPARAESLKLASAPDFREPLLVLVELKQIKRRIEAGTASDSERNYYESNKELAWRIAEDAILADRKARTIHRPISAPITEHTTVVAPARAGQLPEEQEAMVPRERLLLLESVLHQARETLLVSIKGDSADLQRALGNLNLWCKAVWDYETRQAEEADMLIDHPTRKTP